MLVKPRVHMQLDYESRGMWIWNHIWRENLGAYNPNHWQKNKNLIYSGHALSCTALSSASSQACHLNKGNKFFKINVPELRNPTGRRQTSWLFTKRDQGFELGNNRETNPASGRVEALNPGFPDYNTSALNHSATLPPLIEEAISKMWDLT